MDVFELTLEAYGNLESLCEAYDIEPSEVVRMLYMKGLIELVAEEDDFIYDDES